MTKKKSILAFMLAICLMIPATFMLTACGGHKHNYSEDWTYNETYHWHACAGCEDILDKAEHSWGEWTEKTPASNGVNRVEKRICSVCAYEETKTIENSRLDFYMIIEAVETVTGRGTVAKGTIQRGTVSITDQIEVSGCEVKSHVTAIKINKVDSTTATHGDYVEILLRPTDGFSVNVGQFLFKADTMESNTIFKASVTNKNTTPYDAGMQTLDLYVHGINVGTATVVFDEQLDSENTATVRLVFTTELPLYEGLDISLKNGDVETLTGTISK